MLRSQRAGSRTLVGCGRLLLRVSLEDLLQHEELGLGLFLLDLQLLSEQEEAGWVARRYRGGLLIRLQALGALRLQLQLSVVSRDVLLHLLHLLQLVVFMVCVELGVLCAGKLACESRMGCGFGIVESLTVRNRRYAQSATLSFSSVG